MEYPLKNDEAPQPAVSWPSVAGVPFHGDRRGRLCALFLQPALALSGQLQSDRNLWRYGCFRRRNSSACPIDGLGLSGAGFLSHLRGLPSWPPTPNPSLARISRPRSNELRPTRRPTPPSSPNSFP